MFIVALFTITKIWKQPKCPSVDEGIKQLWDVYIMVFNLAAKKNILPFVRAWMDLENITLSEIVTERQIPHFTHTWNLTNKLN